MSETCCGSVRLEAFVDRRCDRHHRNHGSADSVRARDGANDALKKGRERARSGSTSSIIILAVQATSANMGQITHLEVGRQDSRPRLEQIDFRLEPIR